MNLSQIDGDHYNGFNKRGLKAGITNMIYLNEKFDIHTGIIYIQRGSKFPYEYLNKPREGAQRKIHLNYVELPIMLSYKGRFENNTGYRIDIGGSYGRLINSSFSEDLLTHGEFEYGTLQDEFKNVEFNTKMAFTIFINRHIGIGSSFTLQMNRFYKNPLPIEMDPNDWYISQIEGVEHMRNFQIGVFVTYLFFN